MSVRPFIAEAEGTLSRREVVPGKGESAHREVSIPTTCFSLQSVHGSVVLGETNITLF